MTDQYCSESTVTIFETIRTVLRSVVSPTDEKFFKKLTIFGHWLPWKLCDISHALSFSTGLTYLKLYVRGLNDIIIKAIAISCRNLEELHLQGMNFSDSGLKSIVGHNWMTGTNDNVTLGCPGLRILSFIEDGEDSRILFTTDSVIALLSGLPKLRVFDLPTDQVEHSVQFMREPNSSQRLGLTSFKANSSSIELVAIMCPNLTTLNLVLDCKSNFQQIKLLVQLSHLHTLIITGHSVGNDNCQSNDGDDLTTELIYYIFNLIGNRLNHVEIHLAIKVDMRMISMACPDLHTLELTNVIAIKDNSLILPSRLKRILSNVKNMKLLANSDNTITACDLVSLLINCNSLEYLFIGWCDNLTDKVVDELISSKCFELLERLELHEIGPNLTHVGLTNLILSANSIKMINLLGCEGILPEDVLNFQQLVQESNLDISIKFAMW